MFYIKRKIPLLVNFLLLKLCLLKIIKTSKNLEKVI